MAENTTKDLMIFGVLGVGAYFLYQWYTSASTATAATTASQVPTPTPGTTPTMAAGNMPTSVSTTPTSTPTTGGGAQGTSAAMPTVQQPTAADLQSALGHAGTATADQWDYVYQQIMGAPIDQIFGFSFDTVYGAVVGGQRSSGQITAQAFLNAPASAGFIAPQTVQGSSSALTPNQMNPTPFLPVRRPAGTLGTRAALRGLGAITHFYTPAISPLGSMIYRAQHPSPYRYPQTSGSGIGGFTQATGFEQALWASGSLWRNRIP